MEISNDGSPSPDCVSGAPHPCATLSLIGQQVAEATFLKSVVNGRLHHGWLMTGSKGIGKATLAYQISRFLLGRSIEEIPDAAATALEAKTLARDSEHLVTQRIMAGSEANFKLVTRTLTTTGRLSDVIRADDVRSLHAFFGLKSRDHRYRVVLIDAADDLNVQAANALLKVLEEPPPNAVILLIAHQPFRLLPTIRSRCRLLRLLPLAPSDMARALVQTGTEPVEDATAQVLVELSAGSVGTAFRMLNASGVELYQKVIELMATFPRFNRQLALDLVNAVTEKKSGDRLDLFFDVVDIALSRLARRGALGASLPSAALQEPETLARLSPDPQAARQWAAAAATVNEHCRTGLEVNIDPSALILDMIFRLAQTTMNKKALHL